MLADEGLYDGTTLPNGAVYGTVVSATSSSVVLSANSPSDCGGALIYIISGAAKGSQAQLAWNDGAGTSSMSLNGVWSGATPSPGDVYGIGVIPFSLETGAIALEIPGAYSSRAVYCSYDPTLNPTVATFNITMDQNQSPQINAGGTTDTVAVKHLLNKPDIVMDMARFRAGVQGQAVGMANFQFGATSDNELQTNRYVTINLYGAQSQSSVIFYGFIVYGVEDE